MMNSIPLPARPLALKIGSAGVFATLAALVISLVFGDDSGGPVLVVAIGVLGSLAFGVTSLFRGSPRARWCTVLTMAALLILFIAAARTAHDSPDIGDFAIYASIIIAIVGLCLPATGQWYREVRECRDDFLAEFPGDYARHHRIQMLRHLTAACAGMSAVIRSARPMHMNGVYLLFAAITFEPFLLWAFLWHAWQWRLGRRVEAGG